MTVSHAEKVVTGFETLDAAGWAKLNAHTRRDAFLLEYFRAKCMTDFWTFLRYGLYFNQRKHYCDALHGTNRNVKHYDSSGLAAFLQDWTVEHYGDRRPVYTKVCAVARIHCKTQEGIAWDIWTFLRDQNEFELIRSHTDGPTLEILRAVKELVLQKRFQQLFPWLRPQMNGTKFANWTLDSITFEREVTGVRTASITAAGLDTDVTGHHYSKRKYDDWETRDSANSELLRPKLFDIFNLDGCLMVGGGQTLVLGTTYNPDAFMASAVERKNMFADMDYELFVQPAYVTVFNEPITGQEPILLDDRVTFRCEGAGFPTVEENLELCQARLTFFSPAAKDTVIEKREIVWNDGTHFRVNRPIPSLLGQPLAFTIGVQKPAAPNRFTLDSVDILPADPAIEITRQSLDKMELDLGSYVFAAQMKLESIDPKSILLDPTRYVIIGDDDLPGQSVDRSWYRTGDLASAKETGSYTAMVTGFHTYAGIYIMDMQWGNLSELDIELELIMGQLRVQDMGGRLRWTGFEDAHIETSIKKHLTVIQNDPYAYFKQAKGKYAEYAEQFLQNVRGIQIPMHRIKRKQLMQKNDRILARIQPPLEQGRIFVHRRCKHIERLKDESTRFRIDSVRNIDLLDTLSDFIHEPAKPRQPIEEQSMVGRTFRERERAAMQRTATRRYALRWGG